MREIMDSSKLTLSEVKRRMELWALAYKEDRPENPPLDRRTLIGFAVKGGIPTRNGVRVDV